MTAFTLLQNSRGNSEARLGRLEILGRHAINTPHYVAVGSKGTIPHLTPDMMMHETSVQTLHVGFEDYAEQLPKTPPVYSIPCPPSESPLRCFTALPASTLLVLSPRRIPALSPPAPNTYTSLSISTANGFQQLEVSEYIKACSILKPDIIIGPADILLGEGVERPGPRRCEKMVERTLAWVRGLVIALRAVSEEAFISKSIWAPILPGEPETQTSYWDYLEEFGPAILNGLALYENSSAVNIPSSLKNLPLLSLADAETPHQVLYAIDLGLDIFTTPFVNKATDAGIALIFFFPAPRAHQTSPMFKKPLGIDMWSEAHATDLSPIVASCTCYACKSHHRAYIRHLLDAKEMLAWTLLQIHNHHQMDAFFAGIRYSISNCSFSDDMKCFSRVYEESLPSGSEAGPRVRGYQMRKKAANSGKSNKAARKKLGEASEEVMEMAKLLKRRAKLDQAQECNESVELQLFAPDFESENMNATDFAEDQ